MSLSWPEGLKVHIHKSFQCLPGCVTSQGNVITSPTANLKASDLVMNVGSFLFNTWLPAKATLL